MFVRIENSAVVEVFEKKPSFHKEIMKSIIQLEATVGDHIHNGANMGQKPSDYHYFENGAWVENVDEKEGHVQDKRKADGFDYNGVMCSATKDDQNGLMAIFVGFNSSLITETVFSFSNGQELEINEENIQDFALQWSSFRQQFFKKGES